MDASEVNTVYKVVHFSEVGHRVRLYQSAIANTSVDDGEFYKGIEDFCRDYVLRICTQAANGSIGLMVFLDVLSAMDFVISNVTSARPLAILQCETTCTPRKVYRVMNMLRVEQWALPNEVRACLSPNPNSPEPWNITAHSYAPPSGTYAVDWLVPIHELMSLSPGKKGAGWEVNDRLYGIQHIYSG